MNSSEDQKFILLVIESLFDKIDINNYVTIHNNFDKFCKENNYSTNYGCFNKRDSMKQHILDILFKKYNVDVQITISKDLINTVQTYTEDYQKEVESTFENFSDNISEEIDSNFVIKLITPIFENGINFGRIISMIYVTKEVAFHFINHGRFEEMINILYTTFSFFQKNVNHWVVDHGHFESLINNKSSSSGISESFHKTTVIAVAALAGILCTVRFLANKA